MKYTWRAINWIDNIGFCVYSSKNIYIYSNQPNALVFQKGGKSDIWVGKDKIFKKYPEAQALYNEYMARHILKKI